ncbi:type IV pilus assembly protein PilV [Noviherbaspirillum humi]|uniref:Type IV pilus assembly protein PilV n=1 Tax=Noviherbaspirillum humi TaxID=1688639 RepID=A0A239LIN2_9BURK|nr:hypothetical protein [Noviherbaspirillum humi]SNT29772.1 type IV pilus assembly protein PilV [Noviherbaspirillum humi]
MRHIPFQLHARGIALLEALCAILVFSFGVLGLVGLQSVSVGQAALAQYRTDASLLSDELIGRMWASNHAAPSTLQAAFNSSGDAGGGTEYQAWLNLVKATLPGVKAGGDGAVSTLPTVVVDSNGVATITLFWRTPNESASNPPHFHTVVAQIR